MTTGEIAHQLALAARQFPFLGAIDEETLLEVVRWELGHEEILDGFRKYAGNMAMAVGPGTILHVMSGNTPHAALQSLIRGLLLKSHNLCKISSVGLPEIEQFKNALPECLASRIEIESELPQDWLRRADAVIVFGNDQTVRHFVHAVREDQLLITHGHKISLGIVFDDPDFQSVTHAARDASLFDQQGCLSPHVFYVEASLAREYAEKLAGEMESFNTQAPRGTISRLEAIAIDDLRRSFEFRAANDGSVAVWKSRDSTDWTVIFDKNPRFASSCLNRVIYVKPLPSDIGAAVANARPHLSTIAIQPATLENAERVSGLGATRICPVGGMQSPPFTWHQDGGQSLAPLARWVDFESGNQE